MSFRKKRGGPASRAAGGKISRSTLRVLSAVVLAAAAGFAVYSLVNWLQDRAVTERILSRAEIIRRCAAAYDLPVELLEAVIRVESKGDPSAVSRRNAKGLMQVTEDA